MASLEEVFDAVIAQGKIPGWWHFGPTSLNGAQELVKIDALMAFASYTKLINSIAAMQLVESGKWKLDNPVFNILPELEGIPILTQTKDGKAVVTKRESANTLRQLLTHSSDIAYGFNPELIKEYQASLGLTPGVSSSTVAGLYSNPLLFEPGSSWEYGAGIDWVGLGISRITNTSLDDYCQQNIFKPLGITDITFWPERRPELNARRAGMSIRDPDAQKLLPYTGGKIFGDYEEEFGGEGGYGTMPDYLKMLQSLLADDEKILKRETTKMMFSPQLTPESQKALQEVFNTTNKSALYVGVFPENSRYDWGLGGLLTMEDVAVNGAPWRRKGCMVWSGLPNLFWFVDRAAGICGVYGTQLLPAGDGVTREMIGLLDKAIEI
ncbi:hypothetical protein OIDMADRAFT_104621 [Oidiodendron maius Zn]|uniref:Beta-lactamase-related domain-containing protein n=1 Tax=Oidiodendron maius (strain Zn) TaxID=913774 RepID=A0A0C3DCI9_OIDMZ|nr:hypothetical protein OIDMADRAFT_104621 [Oidiodendron maius Zn]